jgi:acetyl/propionyl-CoA carboxylase alpha subunit
VLADNFGNTVHLFERECSIQRRHQKIIEETPSVALDDDTRRKMGQTAVKVAQAADYRNAGTVEFLFDKEGNYYFLEMNTRLQVEHPITEMVTGVDLVVEQIRIAAGLKISDYVMNAKQRGHAIECRIYAEDGENNFLPSSGEILYYQEPSGPGIRVDSGVSLNTVVGVEYDPILAKLVVYAPNREMAIDKMINALKDYKILGIKTSRYFMIEVLSHPQFKAGRTYTDFIETNLSERQVDMESVLEVAAAVSTAASMRTAKISGGGKKETVPSPWQTIGPWEIGARISE